VSLKVGVIRSTDTGSASVAQQTTVAYVDDLDNDLAAEETLPFALDGVSYEIDLTAAHAATLRDDLATWVSHARRTGGRSTTPSPRPRTATGRTTADREQTAAVRAWARSNGYTVSDRGRIPAAVQNAFDAAH
jgi:hypothetical protein